MKRETIRPVIKFKILVSTALVFFAAISANAWNNVGHRAVAEFAWRQMDTAERGAVTELLKQHPHYNQLLLAEKPAGVPTDEWVFLMASVWPDRVRPAKEGQPPKPKSITKYDLYPHAVGYPFLEPGETNRALLKDFFIAKPDAEMVLSNSIATVRNPKASPHDRAVSLGWMLHLFGDLHQPLHTANMVSERWPRGDHLGGHHIAIDARGEQINFHSFWDQLGGTEPTYKTIAALADELSSNRDSKNSVAKQYREDKTIASWVQEGFHVAVDFAYSPKHVRFVHLEDVKSGKISEAAIPRLSNEYVSEAKKIGRERLWLAGQRLADELKKIF